jgi:hypothetical protein
MLAKKRSASDGVKVVASCFMAAMKAGNDPPHGAASVGLAARFASKAKTANRMGYSGISVPGRVSGPLAEATSEICAGWGKGGFLTGQTLPDAVF